MNKSFQCVLGDVDVLASKVPTEYRTEFEGPAKIDPILFAYGTPEMDMVATREFTVEGDYVAKFALYDEAVEILGNLVTKSFSITTTPTIKTIRAATDLIISSVPETPPATPSRRPPTPTGRR